MSARKSFAWAFSGQFVIFVVGFGGSLIVARLLTPHEMGIYAIAMAASGVVQIFASLGIAAYIIRAQALTPRMLDAGFTINAIVSLLLGAILLGASFVARPLLGDAAAGDVLRLIALAPVLNALGFRPAAMLQREMRFAPISVIAVIGAIATTLTTVTAALLGASYMSPAYGALMSPLVGALGATLVAPQHASLRCSLEGWRDILRFGVRIMSISGVAILCTRLAEIVLGRVLGLSALGVYARASTLANMIFENVYGTMTRVIFAQLAEQYRATGELKRGFLQSLRLVTGVMWPLLIGLAVLSGPAIRLLYGERWLGAAAPLSLLMIAQAVVLCFGMNWELFVLRDETARQTRLEVTRSALGLAAVALLAPFGLVAAASGRIVEAAAGLALYARHVRRLAGAGKGEVRRLLTGNALLLIPAAGPAAALMATRGWSPRTPLAEVFAAVIVGALLWLAALARTRHPLWEEMVRVARRLPLSARVATLARRARPSRG